MDVGGSSSNRRNGSSGVDGNRLGERGASQRLTDRYMVIQLAKNWDWEETMGWLGYSQLAMVWSLGPQLLRLGHAW